MPQQKCRTGGFGSTDQKIDTMKKYKIVQVKSKIKRPEKQKRTLEALGVTRMGRPVIVTGSPQVEGMINKVRHLLSVEEVND
jgi:large subunit ribosomal protein L30